MNALLDEIYGTQLVKDSAGNSLSPFPVAIPRETGVILADVVRRFNCTRTLEIGMAYGLSTLWICEEHRRRGTGSHISIDPFQTRDWKSIGLLNVERAGLKDIVRFFEMPSDAALPKLIEENVVLDFAFIDGAHRFDNVLVDFVLVDQLLKVGGFLVFDDLWMAPVRKAVNFILSNRNYRLVPLQGEVSPMVRIGRYVKRLVQEPLAHDFGLRRIPLNICLLEKTSNDKRTWNDYRPF